MPDASFIANLINYKTILLNRPLSLCRQPLTTPIGRMSIRYPLIEGTQTRPYVYIVKKR